MRVHIALYKWKDFVTREQIEDVFSQLARLDSKIPGIIGITCTRNESEYNEGYTHVIFVRGEDETALDAYRNHPEHAKIADSIESMEDRGVGIDFTVPSD